MPRVRRDFADQTQAEKFPQHGWAENSQGVKLLWFPIISLFFDRNAIRRAQGIDKPLAGPSLDAATTFHTTLYRLSLVLRDVYKLASEVEETSAKTPSDDEFRIVFDAIQKIELYVDLAYVYLRRLADHTIYAARPILFAKWGCASNEFKKIRKRASQGELARLQPICDANLLQCAFASHSHWFDTVRKDSGVSGETGVRTALEHRVAHVQFSLQQTGSKRPRAMVFLHSRVGDVPNRLELITSLSEILKELCAFWTTLHRSVGWTGAYPIGERGGYDQRDAHVISGQDDDVVVFWPQL